ncbi:type IV conjugative transfer system coupling protein TraD [Methyloglobulus sp.]|uniref:type IV conjugative transfer system coupling protein TraD n=1 Tax=Methyloglobulus sp. TaxID=2518622 RepID=UPI0032B83AA0
MSGQPLEALLRPPIELWSMLSAGSAALATLFAPHYLMLTDNLSYPVSFGLGVLAVVRGHQAFKVIRYQRNMKRLPLYRMRPDKIPTSTSRLFLGKGFRWYQEHSQRLYDARKPNVRRYIQPGAAYRLARRLESRTTQTWLMGKLVLALSKDIWWNPVPPIPPLGGKIQLHAVGIHENEVTLPLHSRPGNTLVLGTTGVGKTRLAEILITQDIHRGDVVIVFDPKGDADLMKRMVAEAHRAGRQQALTLFHLGYPELSARYNPIGNFSRITEIATRIANQLPSSGDSAAFREFAWRFTNIVGRALVALGRRPDYPQIMRYVTHIDPLLLDYYRQWLGEVAPKGWEKEVMDRAAAINDKDLPFELKGRSHEVIALIRYAKDTGLYDGVADGLRSAFEYDKKYFDKLVASLLPLMEKLVSGKIAELLAPNYGDSSDPRPIFDWMQVIRRGGIVYIGLDALTDTAVSAAVGNAMFADLVSVAGHLYKFGAASGLPKAAASLPAKLPVINLHADEFNELIGDEFIPLLNKARGAGFQVTAYTQTWSDIEARLGNAAKAGQAVGNFNTTIMLRVKELATAEILTQQLDTVDIMTMTAVSGVVDSSDPTSGVDYISRNEDSLSLREAAMLTPADVMSLPIGHAFALLEGGQLWKIRMPLPDASRDPHLPADLAGVAEAMRRKYQTGDNWWALADQDGKRGFVSPSAMTD